MDNPSGITYFNLVSEYSGDTTKKCGLTTNELDGNFYFLRGQDISSLEFDSEQARFVLRKLNGDYIESDAVDAYLTESIKITLSGVNENVSRLENEVSAMSESLESVYEDIDAQICGVTKTITENFGLFSQEIQETRDYLTSYTNSNVRVLQQEISELRAIISALTCSLTCRIERLEQNQGQGGYIIDGSKTYYNELEEALEIISNNGTSTIIIKPSNGSTNNGQESGNGNNSGSNGSENGGSSSGGTHTYHHKPRPNSGSTGVNTAFGMSQYDEEEETLTIITRGRTTSTT